MGFSEITLWGFLYATAEVLGLVAAVHAVLQSRTSQGAVAWAVGLVSFRPAVPGTVNALFYGHVFLVCVLLVYIPFGKLLHMAGAFLSPTRNLANNNRMVRHVNPWDYPVKVHTYEEYEDELRDKMKGAGIPVDKE